MMFKKFGLLSAACVALLSGPAFANPLSDAKAGLEALNKGDNDNAIRLFSQALNSDGLSPSDRELAYVKRAQAYAAAKNTASAIADLNAAAKLVPDDPEISQLRAGLKNNAPTIDANAQDGPSLEATLSFIRDKILGEPRVLSRAPANSPAPENKPVDEIIYHAKRVASVTYDGCIMHKVNDIGIVTDIDFSLVTDVRIESMTDFLTERAAFSHQTLTGPASPAASRVLIKDGSLLADHFFSMMMGLLIA